MSTGEGYTCFEYVYPWPRPTKVIVPRIGIARGSVCVQVRYVLWGLIAKEPEHEKNVVIFKLFLGSLFSSPLISGQ